MTADDELCRLLDEHGVEYERSVWSGGSAVWWKDASGVTWRAHDNEDDGLLTLYAYSSVTPAQAIAATLGAGTCRLKRAQWDDGTCTWGCICTACDAHLEHETGIGYNYCPHCGRKVVDE